MTMSAEKHRYTIAEYLKMEETATDRHEYHDGEILAMSGGTYRHSRINTNLLVALGNRLRGNPCEPLDSNMRVRIASRASYIYPDISIVCGGPTFDVDDPKKTTITNPRVVIEVLSDSTERYDRGRKFDLYREVTSLEEYVLVSQHEPAIATFHRQADGAWLFMTWSGLTPSVALRSMSLTIPLAEIYSRVEFEPGVGAIEETS
ncbi:MAG: Uma2 family endonuclease [Phycisphaerae bacterium]|nr:Uma2 family endonuclease [Phycisphaerae bacterium]